MHRLRRLGSRQLSLLTVVALAGCGGGSGGGDPGWYYHFICNGDPECLSTNFAGAPSGTSNLGPGQAGVPGRARKAGLAPGAGGAGEPGLAPVAGRAGFPGGALGAARRSSG